MLSITGLIIFIILALLIWFWQSSMRAKELAIAASKNACAQRKLQFLDGTTHFIKIRLKRNHQGKVRVLRCYGFDYYNGEARLSSTITTFDHQVIDIGLPPIIKQDNVIPFPNQRRQN